MKFTELEIPGVFHLQGQPFVDDRGSFFRHFCAKEFESHGLEAIVAQGNISINRAAGTLRGFHYQIKPHEEAKTLSCLTGGIYDIVVDLRQDSPTFMKWISVTLEAKNYCSLYLPRGCANAWMTTHPNTIVHYYMGDFYDADSYRGFHYKDPSFGFVWPSEPKIISDQDRNLPNFDLRSLGDK